MVVVSGNPATAIRCLPLLERNAETYGEPQREAFDGGYAPRANLEDAKELGVEYVMFHKKCGLERTDMTLSAWINGQLKRFRAGVEVGTSDPKRRFGMDRWHWRGWKHFWAYVHSTVFAKPPNDLLRLVRLLPICHPSPERLLLTVHFSERFHFNGSVLSWSARPAGFLCPLTVKLRPRGTIVTFATLRSAVSTRLYAPTASPAPRLSGDE